MRKTILTTIMAVGLHAWGLAQGTAHVDYWIDNNPVQSITATGPDIIFDADVSTLPRGLHTLNYRYQNADGKWSVPYSHPFLYIGTHDGSRRFEYWFDHDHARRVSKTVTSNVISTGIDMSHLSRGLHTFVYRYQDALGHWSVPYNQLIVYTGQQPQHANNWRMEYWFDRDVTQKQSVTSSTPILAIDADVSTLQDGVHTLTYRISDDGGLWSIPHTAFFIKPRGGHTTTNLVTAYQYWFDKDFDHATLVNFDEPASPIILDINIPTEDLETEVTPDNLMVVKDDYGIDVIGRRTVIQVRFRDTNGHWSDIQGEEFANIIEEPDLTPFIRNPKADEQTNHWTIDGTVSTPTTSHYTGEAQPYFHLSGSQASMSQAISGLPAMMTYRLSFMARTHGTTLTITAGDKTQTVTSEAWTRQHIDFTPTDETFDILIEATANSATWADIDDLSLGIAIDETPMNEGDWALLKTFYNEMGGSAWTKKWTFGSNAANTGRLPGVKTRAGRVTRVSLPSNNLSGTLSASLFTLPELMDINLSGNAIHGDIATLMGQVRDKVKARMPLKYLDLSDNRLTGNAGAIGDLFPELISLNLAGCHLTQLTPVLPQHIEKLDISRQTIDESFTYNSLIDTKPLMEKMPTILLYQHATRDYKSDIVLSLADAISEPTWRAQLQLRDNGFHIQRHDANTSVYRQSNGAMLQATAGNHQMSVKFDFAPGDIDFNGRVNVGDLQRAINLSLERPMDFFNHTAANIIADDVINVQDVVALVREMIAPASVMKKAPAYLSAHETGTDNSQAHVYIENGQLIVESELPVAAFDITLAGGDSTPTWLLDDMGMQCTITQEGATVRLIGYSIMGQELPAGRTAIAQTSHTTVVSAELVDSEALDIDTSLNTSPTAIATVTDDLMVTTHGQHLRLWSNRQRSDVTWNVYTLAGQLIGSGNIDHLTAGHTTLCLLPRQPVVVKVTIDDSTLIKKISTK